MRAPRLILALCLLRPSLGLADEFLWVPNTPAHALEEFQRWTGQRRAEDSVRLEDQRRDAERAFDKRQEEIRLRRIEQRLDQLEQSRGTR